MPVSLETKNISIKAIRIERDKRQRKIFTTDDLEESIKRRGLFHPIVIRESGTADEYILVIGERRITAFINLGRTEIPARILSETDETTARIVELEENVRRQNVSWDEECLGVLDIHKGCLAEDQSWTVAKTADLLGYEYVWTTILLKVAEEVQTGSERVLESSGIRAAYSYIQARDDKRREQAEASLQATITSDFGSPSKHDPPEEVKAAITAAESGTLKELETSHAESADPILCEDAIKFFQSYDGVPCNLLHCDFPYGIDIQDSDYANANEHGTYEDSPEIYWGLLGALCSNLDKVVSSSAHIIFWFSPRNGIYEDTLKFFSQNAPDLWVQDIPLVWHKTDNKGVMADALRRPRNITEFAFLISRGDRKLVESTGNCYGAPTSRLLHQSEKPVPVLKHFFRMVVDETTRLLDPTAGSGNALIAADTLGAESVFGLEKDPKYADRANEAFRKYRKLKQLEQQEG